MDIFKAPPPLQFTENISQKWKIWRQLLNNFMVATEMIGKPDKTKVAMLLNLIGSEGLEVYNTFDFATTEDGADDISYDIVLEKFEQYCAPKKNVVYERFKFFTRIQLEHESIDQYVTALKGLIVNCEFAERESLLRDRVVLGTRYKCLQEKMLREPDLKLSRAVEYCQAYELSKTQIKDIHGDAELDVHKINIKKEVKGPQCEKTAYAGKKFIKTNKSKCCRCGYVHEYKKCPAFKKVCKKCSKLNHFAKMCKSQITGTVSLENEPKMSDESSVIWEIKENNNSKDWIEVIKINDKDVALKIDPGSHVNIINKNLLNKLAQGEVINNRKVNLVSYTGHEIKVHGIVSLKCDLNGKTGNLEFNIVDKWGLQSLLGLEASYFFGLINPTMNDRSFQTVNSVKYSDPKMILDKYKSVFEGVGKLKNHYRIRLKEGAIPVTYPARKIPISYQELVKEQLDEMIQKEILIPVTEPTEWASPIVITPKADNKIRMCMDPRYINSFVIRERCWIPTPETIFASLSGARVFTVLDASSAFHQNPLEDESSFLCTIATPYGRYRYTRMPYGLSSAPEVFQQAVADILEGLPGVSITLTIFWCMGRLLKNTMKDWRRS